jgi:hypothetical protein
MHAGATSAAEFSMNNPEENDRHRWVSRFGRNLRADR